MAIRFLYPCYFDSELTRAKGRRVAKQNSVPSPALAQVSRAVKYAGYTIISEDKDASHPARWFAKEGRLSVECEGSKEELLRKVGEKLNKK